jgi:hypothetical protein
MPRRAPAPLATLLLVALALVPALGAPEECAPVRPAW